MDLTHKKLKTSCRKNQYKLTLSFMEGDADGYEEGEIFSEKFEGLIVAFFDYYSGQIRERVKGQSNEEREDAQERACQHFEKFPEIVELALKSGGYTNKKHTRDALSDYLAELGHGMYGPGYSFPRVIDSLSITHFDEVGDEYEVFSEKHYDLYWAHQNKLKKEKKREST